MRVVSRVSLAIVVLLIAGAVIAMIYGARSLSVLLALCVYAAVFVSMVVAQLAARERDLMEVLGREAGMVEPLAIDPTIEELFGTVRRIRKWSGVLIALGAVVLIAALLLFEPPLRVLGLIASFVFVAGITGRIVANRFAGALAQVLLTGDREPGEPPAKGEAD